MRIWRSSVTSEYYKQPSPSIYEAQAITPEDISSIEAITILDEILGRARPQYKLRGICRPIRMDSLTARIDIATALTGQEKVPALVEAEIAAESYTAVDFELWKNVVHVVISDEAAKKAAHDLLNLHVDDAARDISRMENKQIAWIDDHSVRCRCSVECGEDFVANGPRDATQRGFRHTVALKEHSFIDRPHIPLLRLGPSLQVVGMDSVIIRNP